MRHRWDIQLLRALAVLSVLAYHAGVPHAQGGSLGVDVFFVISGYLITVTWLRRPATGSADRVTFLRHRLARTLPAAAVAALAISVVVAIIARDRWVEMGWHALASVTATENLLVSGLTWDGWNASLEALTPYTHFWSMATEVQFYVIWPLVLAGVFGIRSMSTSPLRGRAALLLVLASVAVGSAFVYASWGVSSHAVAYFSPVTRAWQLAVGAALGLLLPTLRPSRPVSPSAGRWAVVGTVLGGSALLYCFLFGGFARETDSPLWGFTVVAVTAALLVVGRWLPAVVDPFRRALAPLLAIGTISYGLYLWHLPVLWTVSELGWVKTPLWWVTVMAVSVTAATLSWHWVEKPAIAWSRRRSAATPEAAPTPDGQTAASRQRQLARV